MPQKSALGSYLKAARLKSKLSIDEVAEHLELRFPMNILQWERNEISTLRLTTLKKLIRLYKLDARVVFDLLLQLKLRHIEIKIKKSLKEEK